MEKIVHLSEYRKSRRTAGSDSATPDSAPHYYCQRCDTDQFKLFASGEVHCAHCGALMRNILVHSEPPSRTGN